jgi:hypothetical protein
MAGMLMGFVDYIEALRRERRGQLVGYEFFHLHGV